MKKRSFTPDIDQIPQIQGFVEDYMTENQVPMKVVTSMMVVIDELCSNIVFYSGADIMEVTLNADDDKHDLSICFSDNGTAYDPLQKEDPDVTLSAEERQIGGLGIFLVKKMTDNVTYERIDDRNVLTIYKKW